MGFFTWKKEWVRSVLCKHTVLGRYHELSMFDLVRWILNGFGCPVPRPLYVSLFMVALGLCCCTQAFSSCSDRGLLFTVVHRLLITVAFLMQGHGL